MLIATRTPNRTARHLTLGLLGLAACSGSPGPGLTLRLAGAPVERGCLLASGRPVETQSVLVNGSLRLTALRRDVDKARFVCDAKAVVPTEQPILNLGPGDPARIDLYAELFSESGQRTASGSLRGFTAATGEKPVLTLFATESWSCPSTSLGRARAFHTATLLPNGDVLILGGVEPLPDSGVNVFGLIDSAEVYDSRRHQMVPLTVPIGSITPRAFHHVAVVTGNETSARLVVYGGITFAARQPVLYAPSGVQTLRLMPAGGAASAGGQLLVYDAVAHTLVSSPIDTAMHKTALSGADMLPGGGLVVAGGTEVVSSEPFSVVSPAMLNSKQDYGSLAPHLPDLTAAPTAAYAPITAMTPWMLGPSVRALSRTTALVLGTTRTGSGPKWQALPITGLPENPTLPSPTGIDVPGAATVFHTATRLGPELGSENPTGPTQILLTGGFVTNTTVPYVASVPPSASQAVRLYTVNDVAGTLAPIDYQSVAAYGPAGTCGMQDGHYRPAGRESAAATLSGKQVLITGGIPNLTANGMGCVDCEPQDQTADKRLCMLRQASIFDAETQTLRAAPLSPLGRAGHQLTRLLDGAILVSGGLVRPGDGTTVTTAEVEIFNPLRTMPDPPDENDPLTAALKDANATHTGSDPASPCARL